jgi:hypothetical protein
MWIGGRNTGNEKPSDEEELKCSLKRKRREEKKSMFHIERGIDWKRGNAQLYVTLMLLQFPYSLFVHFIFIPAFEEQNVSKRKRI